MPFNIFLKNIPLQIKMIMYNDFYQIKVWTMLQLRHLMQPHSQEWATYAESLAKEVAWTSPFKHHRLLRLFGCSLQLDGKDVVLKVIFTSSNRETSRRCTAESFTPTDKHS